MTRLGDLLHTELDARGLRKRAPSLDEWQRLLGELQSVLEEEAALEDLVSASVGDTVRLRHALASSYTEVNDAIALMTEAVTTFHEAARDAEPDGAQAARAQFAEWISGSWFGQPIATPPDELTVARTPLVNLHQRLRGLAWALGDLVEDVSAAGAVRRELARAGAIQRGLVPGEATTVPGLSIASWFEPASRCAGDWWSAHALTETDGLLIVGDVTGHGAASSMVTAVIRGACDVARLGMRQALRPSQLMRMLNRILRDATGDEFMMTAVVLRVAQGGGKATITNAGHRPPLRVHGGQVAPVQVVRDPPLGASESHAYEEAEVEALPGDLFVLYTDGVPEAENAAGVAFGEKLIRQLAVEGADDGPAVVRDRIRAAVLEHRGSRPASDDVCLVVAAVTEGAPPAG